MMLLHAILAVFLAFGLHVSAFQQPQPQSIVSHQHHRLDAGVVKTTLRSLLTAAAAASGLEQVSRSTPNDDDTRECAKGRRRLSLRFSSWSSRAVLTASLAAFAGLVARPLAASAAIACLSFLTDPVVTPLLALFAAGCGGIVHLEKKNTENSQDLKGDIRKLESNLETKMNQMEINLAGKMDLQIENLKLRNTILELRMDNKLAHFLQKKQGWPWP